jgi:site-specific recombinase XerD
MNHLNDFFQYLESQDRSPLTVRGYRQDLAHFERWFVKTNGEACSLAAITPSDVRTYRQYLLTEERRKASTVNRRLAALSALMAWAVQSRLLEHDPSQGVRNVPQVGAGPRYLDKKQQYALQRAIEKDLQITRLRYPKRWRGRQRDGSLVLFLLHTGLRLQEALDLRLSDVQMTDRKGLVLVRQGKGGKQRSVPLNVEARKALQDWLKVRPENANDFIWVAVESEGDGPLSGRSVQRVILRIGQDAGLDILTPHMLRHTFGKNLVDNGIGLEKVAALLGHANLNTTRIYVTPNQHDLEQAVDCLAETTISRR